MNSPLLGELITIERKKKGWTMAELSRRTGLSRSYLHAVENGQIKSPSFDSVMCIAFTLGANPLDWWCVPDGYTWSFHWMASKNAEFAMMFDTVIKRIDQEQE